MLASMGLTPSISPSLCRQVFVSERRSAERVGGPSDRGAAMLMGHSLAQWTKWYDLDFHARETQQAVDAMSTWRHNLLTPQASASPSTPLQPLPQPELQQQVTANQPSPTKSQDAIAKRCVPCWTSHPLLTDNRVHPPSRNFVGRQMSCNTLVRTHSKSVQAKIWDHNRGRPHKRKPDF